MQPSRTYVAFAELLQEWAEIPAEGPDQPRWGAALAYEMIFGIWRGCNVRVLSSDDPLYALLVCQRPSATLWRNRTADLTARAQDMAAAFTPAASAPADEPTVPTVPATDASDLEPTLDELGEGGKATARETA
jgi:hypothetical protein